MAASRAIRHLHRSQASSVRSLSSAIVHVRSSRAHFTFLPAQRHVSTESLPTITQPSFWRAMTPKFLRKGSESAIQPATLLKKKEWNPATYFIIIFLLIGSQAIQTMALQNGYQQFTQETEAKLAKLREVVRRIQNGEDVDVAAELGTGDKVQEKGWEEVMRELEEDDSVFQSRRKRWRAKEAAKDASKADPVDEEEEDKKTET